MKWFIIIVRICTIAFLVTLTQISTEAKAVKEVDEYVPNEETRENVEIYWQIMRAAIYDNVTTDKAEDFNEDMEWFAGFVKERSELYGELQSIDIPTYSSPDNAAIVVRFEKNVYVFNLTIDNKGEIAKIEISNFAPEENLSKLTWEDLGEDTLRAIVIDEISSFKEVFERDNGKVRLVSILSPT